MIENLRAADTGFFGNVVVSCYCQIWFINPYFSFFLAKIRACHVTKSMQ